MLGHYLMDHIWVAGGASGQFPDVTAPTPSLGAPQRPTGLYTIRMRNTMNGPRSKDYIRGFGFQGGGSPRSTSTRRATARRSRRASSIR